MTKNIFMHSKKIQAYGRQMEEHFVLMFHEIAVSTYTDTS